MGEVFKAWDMRLMRHVALKLILDAEPHRVARFRHEAQAQARVGHPNVCQVYEVGEHDGQHYIAMQYIAGQTLADALAKATLEERLTVMKSVAEALHVAHRQGLVHRDVKPTNIMVESADGGSPKAYVLDFGLALEQTTQLTTTFELLGTPQFMAPEQLNEETRLDRRTDVYALGASFYTVIAGRPPFQGSLPDVMRKVVEKDPAPLTSIDPTLPADVATILAKCLEKEPQRRYESARALADDLDRYLNGEPITARPQTLAYRLAKKARKHSLLLTVAATLLLALLGSLAWGWQSRRTAAEKARLAQRFGQKVERIEALVRFSDMLPLHDTTDDLDRIRELMAQIEDEMRELGDVAVAPGHYALGRGHFVLRDGERARDHLQRAWDEGYRTPEAALALGQALGRLYQRGLEELRRIPDEEQRKRRRSALEAKVKEPALALLRQGRGAALDSPDLVRAQLAYYSGQLPEALTAADAALAQTPWLYEAWVLKGHVYNRLAYDKARRGDHPGAAGDYDRSLQAYGAALDVGRSHVVALEAICAVRLEMVHQELRHGAERVEQFLDDGFTACRRVLSADPRSSNALDGLAGLHYRQGEHLAGHGEDPRPSFLESIAKAEEALAVRPGWATALNRIGDAHLRMGVYAMAHGEDPSASFTASAEALGAALEADARFVWAHKSLGNVHLYETQYALRVGEEPHPPARKAIEAYGKAISLDPDEPTLYSNMGIVHLYLAFSEQNQGRDVRGELDEAVASFRLASEKNPNHAFVHANIGDAFLIRAQYEHWIGEDPRESCEAGVAAYEKALEISPNYAPAYLNTAQVRTMHAGWELEHERDPQPFLSEARRAVEKALEINPAESQSWVIKAQVGAIDAAWKSRGGEEVDLAPQVEALEQALKLNPENVDAHLVLSEIHRQAADNRGDAASRHADLRRALAAAERALEVHPENPRALAEQETVKRALRDLPR